MKNKKGMSLGEGFPAVLTLVLIALIVIIGIFIFTTMTVNMPSTTSATTINETGSFDNYVLKNASSCGANSPAITRIINLTDSKLIAAGNYTFTTSEGVWTLKNTTSQLYPTAGITYTFLWGSGACLAATTSAVQFGTYPALIGLIGTIIFLALVIGSLIGVFQGNKGV